MLETLIVDFLPLPYARELLPSNNPKVGCESRVVGVSICIKHVIDGLIEQVNQAANLMSSSVNIRIVVIRRAFVLCVVDLGCTLKKKKLIIWRG